MGETAGGPGPGGAAALAAGREHLDRWLSGGGPADRELAIRHLTAYLATEPAGGPLAGAGAGVSRADVHAALGRLHGSRYADRPPGPAAAADLAAAIRHARAGLSLATAAGGPGSRAAVSAGTVAELHAILGFALADRCADRLPADPAARADREEAITELAAALVATVDGGEGRTAIRAALGRLYYERHRDQGPGSPPGPPDLDRAIRLLTTAAQDGTERQDLEILVLALHEKYTGSAASADRDAFLTWGQALLAVPGQQEATDLQELVGLALLERAGEAPASRRADLTAAIGQLAAALAAAPAADPGRGELAGLLAQACWQRADGDASSYSEIDQMTEYATEAWRLLPAGDRSRPEIGLYLATGIHERLLRPGQPFDPGAASLAIDVLTEIEPALAGDFDQHTLVIAMLGHFLVARGQATGRAADLAAAQQWVTRAIDQVPAGDPRWQELTQTLAASVSVLAMLGMSADYTDRAIGLLTAATARPAPGPGRAVLNHQGLGTLLLQRAQFSGAEQDLDDGISQLRAAWELAPEGDVSRIAVALNLGSGLLTRFIQRGGAQDLDAAGFYLDVADDLAARNPALRSLMADTEVTLAATRGMLRLLRGQAGDAAALDQAVHDFQAALAMLPPGHPHEQRIRSDLGVAMTARAGAGGGDQAGLRAALAQLRTAAEALPAGHLMRPVTLLRVGGLLTALAAAGHDPSPLAEAISTLTGALGGLGPRFAERPQFLAAIGLAHATRYRLTGDRASLGEATRWLAGACRELAGRPGHPELPSCLTQLAQCYRAGGQARRARQAGLAALRELGRSVLLQTGTGHGLRAAELAAAEAAQVAGWCLDDGEPEAAVAAIELGRGLILHAATAVTSVPELLAQAGQGELAAEWRAAAASYRQPLWDSSLREAGHGDRLLAGITPLEVPDELRRRVLAALTGAGTGRLLAPPAPAQIGTALASTGADALIYLLAPAGGGTGHAIIVPAAGRPAAAVEVLPLPLLRNDEDGPLARYAAAHPTLAGRSPGGLEPPGERWQALAALCEWAYPAVMKPLLQRAGQWGLGHLPRLVLVPAGLLSTVPWHAACASGSGRYACADAVLSYAASGRQLMDVAERPGMPAAASPVIVGNPAANLPFSGLEAQAIRDRCYPAGRYLGFAAGSWGRAADGTGSPEEVLAQLPGGGPGGASVLHLGCHAAAVESAPGRSWLELAGGQRLTVEEILRRATGRPPRAAGGLVSLAACTSDRSGLQPDEALTLATAFLAAGAVTVVGARWEIPDDATSLLMFMFHYFLAAEGCPPRDALRQAQLWMIDPAREAPPLMPERLAKDARHPGHADLASWAAFTHQGR